MNDSASGLVELFYASKNKELSNTPALGGVGIGFKESVELPSSAISIYC
jgi:hypothetical protein